MQIRKTFDKGRQLVRHSNLLWKNKGVLPAVTRGYFNTLVLQKTVLRTIEFAIVAECNVNCEMCYATKIVDKDKKRMTVDEYASVWQQAKKMGAFSVHLSGGEPTLRKDLPEIIGVFDPGKTIISMTTNSSVLRDGYLEKLRNAGLSCLHFSLNSPDPVVNDRQRDHVGHYDLVMQKIDEAVALDYEICLSIVVAKNNLADVRKLVRLTKQKGIGVVFSLATPSGNWTGATDELLDMDDWGGIDALMDSTPHIRSDWTINLDMKKGCPAGYEKIAISPYGDVQGCAMLFVSHGNVRKEPLVDVVERMREWSHYKKRAGKCLIALDRPFIDEVILSTNKEAVLPVPVESLAGQ
jgi:MoaA/NifB/PqqE/SkfB family radical SAM enzyme